MNTTSARPVESRRPGFLRRNWKIVAPASIAGVGLLAWLAIGFFGVHTLFFDRTVDEAGPVFTSGAGATEPVEELAFAAPAEPADASATAPEPAAETPSDNVTDNAPETPADTSTDASADVVTVVDGEFEGRAHPTSGQAVVLTDGTDQRFLRFENFETDNGPDLNVYLAPGGDVSQGFVDLGDLKGNIGTQNYEIPPDVDLDVFDTVVIWCVRFSVSFGEAGLG